MEFERKVGCWKASSSKLNVDICSGVESKTYPNCGGLNRGGCCCDCDDIVVGAEFSDVDGELVSAREGDEAKLLRDDSSGSSLTS